MRQRRRPHAARGMALVAVLWIVAALSLLVASVTQGVRQHVRSVGTVRDAVVAQAQADAAIHLALQALHVSPSRPQGLQAMRVDVGAVAVDIVVQPLTGFIDLDRAPAPLLASLLKTAGGLPSGQAEALAQTMVEWRGPRAGRAGEPNHFEAAEDLLLVPGMDYALFRRLESLVTTEQAGSAGVNPLAANVDVLTVLAQGNASLASRIATARDAAQAGIDTTALASAFVASGGTERYRVEARVPTEGGKMEAFARTIVFAESPSGVPWRTLRTERRAVPAGAH